MNCLGNHIERILQDVDTMQVSKRTTMAAMESIAAMMEETAASTNSVLSDVEQRSTQQKF